MQRRMIVAVDGPAGSGKSSVCREAAVILGIQYVDSGAIYRAITLFLLRKHGALQREIKYIADLSDLKLEQHFGKGGVCSTFINGEDVSAAIRDELIAKNIGIVSDDPDIRDFVNSHLRESARSTSIIMDGRDIGTVVFPDADIKIYLDASVDERTRRRCAEYRALGKTVDVNAVRNQIIQRDSEDTGRPVGALRKAEDAIVLDTTAMTKDEVISRLVDIVEEKMAAAGSKKTRDNAAGKGYTEMINHAERFEEQINMEHVANTAPEDIRPNIILKGEVVTVDGEFAYVNVGAKSEGRVALAEFETPPRVGDEIPVMLVDRRMLDGMYVFSAKAAERKLKWNGFMEYYRAGNNTITGNVKEVGKNGLHVHCMGLQAFVPFSQAGDIKIKKATDGTVEYKFKIKKIDEKRQSVLLSRKEYLDEETERVWNEFIGKHAVGDRIKGRVLRFVESGAIIEVEGVEAFLAKENMSWKKIFKRRKILKQGTEREFAVIALDQEKRKVELGLKQLEEDPWSSAESKYQVGGIVAGKVVTITGFGVFVELDDGIEGLVGNNDLSWTKKAVNPRDLFKPGQKVEAQVLGVDKESRKMSLGIKQLQPNPWDSLEQRYPVGTIMKGKVKTIVPFGIFVEVEEGIDGLVHVSDISWEDDNKNSLENYKPGDEIEFKILGIDKEEMRISCGIKQLTKSPWEMISEKYPPRTRLAGVVTRITGFGLFVRLEDGIEGLVHVSEASRRKVEDLNELFKVGDTVNVVVLGVDVEKRRLSLSIKHYDMMTEKEELNRILQSSSPSKVTIGDIMKNKLSGDR